MIPAQFEDMTDDYFVGLFDGEGCVTTQVRRGPGASRWQLRLTLSMADRRPIDALAQRWGGGVCVTPRPAPYATMYRWNCAGTRAIAPLELLARRAVVKQRQAVLALELARSMAAHQGRRISPAEHARRDELVAAIRDCNGARGRYDPARLAALKARGEA